MIPVLSEERSRLPPLGEEDIRRPLIARLELVARLQPGAAAVEAGGEVVTYGDLLRRVDAVAAALAGEGVTHNTVVAVLDGRTAWSIAALLGTIKAGAICAPQDGSHPPAYLTTVLEDVDAGIVLSDQGGSHLAGAVGARRFIDVESLAHASATTSSVQPDDPAIVCYTSGSSGRPKGIVHSNANLVHRAWVQSERLGFSPSDRHTLPTTIATGAGLSSVCRVLLSGGTLLWGSPLSVGLDVHWAWLRERRPTVIRATPSLFRSMLRETPEALTLPDVRIVLLGGERVSSADVEACRSLVGPSCLFVNAYSCTETSNATLFVTRCDQVPADGDLPVGSPVSGMHVSILDSDGDPVARGETGEVAVTGRYVALGYWRDPERTAARFRTGADGIRTYLTGDLGLIRLDGLLELRGRIDARVKIRGQRIEVEEIERALDEHGDVEASAVVEVAGPEAASRLAACIVAKDGRAPAPSDLRAFLEQRLPASKVPTDFVRVEALPMTSTGKLDRRALPDLVARADRAVADDYATDRQREIAAMWTQVTGQPPSSVDEDFLACGGDSLAGARLLARLAARWGVRVSFAEFLDHATVAQLAALVDRIAAR